jgi:hypothetical protein
MRSSAPVIVAVAASLFFACEPQQPALAPDPPGNQEPSTPDPKPVDVPGASTEPDAPSRPPAIPAPAGVRGSFANEVLRSCKTPEPPKRCATDADCAIVDLVHGQPCPATLRLGVTASEARAYQAKAICQMPKATAPPPPCHVHWHRAEDGENIPPADSEIVVHCVKAACLTQYGPRP